MTGPLIELNNVDVCLDGRCVLTEVNWRLFKGQHWAVLGGNGAGKSTFLKLVRGEIWPAPGKGERIYHLDGQSQRTAVGVKEQMPMVSPEAQDRYLQLERRLRVRHVVYSGFGGMEYLFQQPTSEQRKFADQLIAQLGVTDLILRDVQELSTGELRRVLIARALVARPKVLLLDEVCDGLDAPARRRLLASLNRIAKSGTQLIYTTHRAEELIPAITHALVLKDGQAVWQGPAKQVTRSPVAADVRRLKLSGIDDFRASLRRLLRSASKPLIRIEHANVFLQRKRVLHDIVWEMRDGENWAVFGRNGSGKTTFLKLVCGDVHPAIGSRIQRFNCTARNTLWEIRKRIGFISPALQAGYRDPSSVAVPVCRGNAGDGELRRVERLTGAQVVASGFFSGIGLIDHVTPKQWRRVKDLLATFGLEELANVSALKMSYGDFRKILLLRALVHGPAIVVCDEPLDGLDREAREVFSAALDNIARNGVRLVVVTHHPSELPRSITHALVLENGRIVCQGAMGEVRNHPAMQRLFGLL